MPVFDADADVHRLQGRGGALVPAIEARFPAPPAPNGVDRAALGRAVFGDPCRARPARGDRPPRGQRAAREAFLIEHAARRWWCSTSRCCSRQAAIDEVDAVAGGLRADPEIQRRARARAARA